MYVCMYVCMYITRTVQHIYFTAEMYGVVLYTDDVQLLHVYIYVFMYVCMYVCFLYMTSVPIHQRIGTQIFFH